MSSSSSYSGPEAASHIKDNYILELSSSKSQLSKVWNRLCGGLYSLHTASLKSFSGFDILVAPGSFIITLDYLQLFLKLLLGPTDFLGITIWNQNKISPTLMFITLLLSSTYTYVGETIKKNMPWWNVA